MYTFMYEALLIYSAYSPHSLAAGVGVSEGCSRSCVMENYCSLLLALNIL